jgi:hypothetical protein
VVQEYSYKIYFVIFGHFYKFLRILEICTIFWELNQLKNGLKLAAQCRAEIGPWLQCKARRPAMRGWSKGRLGLGLAAHVATPLRARRARWRVVTARIPRAGRRGRRGAGGG